MAASLKDDLIAKDFGEETDKAKSPRAALDGLVAIEYDRVDRDYQRDGDGDKFVKTNTYILLRYQPPSNTSLLDFYANSDAILVIERVIPAGAGKGSLIYTTRLKRVWHRRLVAGASYQDEYEILLRVESVK